MTDKAFEEGRRFAEFLEGLSDVQRNELSRKNIASSMKEHAEFSKAYRTGKCYICHKKFGSFDRNQPCFHWFLRPDGATKNDIKQAAAKFGFFRVQSYLRWLANEESFAKNINDLVDEGTGKLIEVTIKYKEFEWSFSVTNSDFIGHTTTQNANHSHYHLQMKIGGRLFIQYRDFHIPFSRMDIINLVAKEKLPEIVRHSFAKGEGMQDLMQAEVIQNVLNSPGDADEDDATFNISTIAVADEGTKMSGEDIYNVIQEAKSKGVTVASLMHKLQNASTTVTVTPGPSVVEQASRTGGRRKRP